jgi:hypothetical protein
MNMSIVFVVSIFGMSQDISFLPTEGVAMSGMDSNMFADLIRQRAGLPITTEWDRELAHGARASITVTNVTESLLKIKEAVSYEDPNKAPVAGSNAASVDESLTSVATGTAEWYKNLT